MKITSSITFIAIDIMIVSIATSASFVQIDSIFAKSIIVSDSGTSPSDDKLSTKDKIGLIEDTLCMIFGGGKQSNAPDNNGFGSNN